MTAPEGPTRQHRVLVVTSDVLGEKMAGPGIRAWEIANALHTVADIRLVSNESASIKDADFPVFAVTDETLKPHVDWADVLVFHGGILSTHPWIRETDTIIVADVYDPIHLEALELGKDLGEKGREALVYSCEDALNVQLERADFVLCASEKQRDFWLGHLGALGRIRPSVYDADISLRGLIDIAPFGVSELPPTQSRHAIKGTVPGISPDDKVIIWGGGIYNWFDPLSLIRAVAKIAELRSDVKLYFLGVKHPNPNVPTMQMAADAMQLSDELGLTDRFIFFNTGWVDYEDRINYLLDADLGVSTHFDHVETAFSFRTRILDYLWAGLPIVSTAGDTFAPIIQERNLGKVVDPESTDDLTSAILEVLFGEEHEAIARNVTTFGQEMTWSKVLQPLVNFCKQPRHSADYAQNGIQTHRSRADQGFRQQIETMATHIKALEAAQTEIYQSTSWRLTAPLRAFRQR